MSKWNKQAQPLSEEFLQNEERRKQMIIEAARRRREQEKKQAELQQQQKKDNDEALLKHKQHKKEAYIKYLRNNLHDKYEDAKKKQKEEVAEIKPKGWKKKNEEIEGDDCQQLRALDLDIQISGRKQHKQASNSKAEGVVKLSGTSVEGEGRQKDKKRPTTEQFRREWLAAQFEREWKQESQQELLASKLLDSLDLDINTMARDKEMKMMMRNPKKEEINQLRELIGYESIVMHQKIESKPTARDERRQKLKKEDTNVLPLKPKLLSKPEVTEVQVFNELKHKKQAKIMNWAIQEEQEAEDLFSNCSSRKTNKALRQLNEELKLNKVKPNLPVISEEQVAPAPVSLLPSSSQQAPKQLRDRKTGWGEKVAASKEKIGKRSSKDKDERSEKSKSLSKKELQQPSQMDQKIKTSYGANNKTILNQSDKQGPQTTLGFKHNQARPKATSKDSNQKKEKKYPHQMEFKQVSKEKQVIGPNEKKVDRKANENLKGWKQGQGRLPPLPSGATCSKPELASKLEYNNSLQTYDLQIDIDEFIRQDLIDINEKERKLQQQLRELHNEHRSDLVNLYKKHGVKSDYKHSSQLAGTSGSKASSERTGSAQVNEEEIEQSIQNLDHLLIRRELVSSEKEAELETEQKRSVINPFSNSEDLCQQILQLAKNVSRFQKKPTDQPVPDGYLSKIKSMKGKKEDPKQCCQKNVSAISELMESDCLREEKSAPCSALPPPPSMSAESSFDKAEKIHVNVKLLKGLLED